MLRAWRMQPVDLAQPVAAVPPLPLSLDRNQTEGRAMSVMDVTDRQRQAQTLLAAADDALGRQAYAQALGLYRQVFGLGFESYPIHVNAAQCLKRMGDLDLAFQHFDRGFRIRRRPDLWAGGVPEAAPMTQEGFGPVAGAALAGQLEYLSDLGRIDWFTSGIAEDLRGCRLTAQTAKLMARASYLPPVTLPEEVLNPAPRIRRVALSGGAGDCFYILDDVLSDAGRQAVLEYLLQATIWFDARESRGYLGAHLHDGFANALVLRLAREMQATITRLAAPVDVAQLWAFRYLRESQGIDIHADQGDWNLNIWPVDHAHLQAEEGAGGMTLYDLKIGADIPFAEYNARPELNRQRIAQAGAQAHPVPYRGNRAVLFPSKYLHQTNAARFADTHEGRRINITMMADLARPSA
ncbi:hypothetical protein ABEB22_15715 (plasmid) [Thioclava sp. 'Guangxiensis']|uniref:hypothetical protein n=1 Tax=Thioclava sp. 'Guangxiensis' TaxID=3149044 RepID=UPI003877FA29